MEEFIKWTECIEDSRPQSKIRYTVQEVVLIVFCTELCRLEYLREYLPYENGVLSHDTMQRVIEMISIEYLQQAVDKGI